MSDLLHEAKEIIDALKACNSKLIMSFLQMHSPCNDEILQILSGRRTITFLSPSGIAMNERRTHLKCCLSFQIVPKPKPSKVLGKIYLAEAELFPATTMFFATFRNATKLGFRIVPLHLAISLSSIGIPNFLVLRLSISLGILSQVSFPGKAPRVLSSTAEIFFRIEKVSQPIFESLESDPIGKAPAFSNFHWKGDKGFPSTPRFRCTEHGYC